MADRDLNPSPRLKNPNRVTPRMMAMALRMKVWRRDPKDGRVYISLHDVTTNTDKAILCAKTMKMFFVLTTPQGRGGNWECTVPPARGRFYRQFFAKTAAKAICAALLDWIDHPRE